MRTKNLLLIGIITCFVNVLSAQNFTNYTTSNSGLPDDFINGGVVIDQNNNKWFGTGAGVAKFDDVNWTVYTTVNGLIDDFTTCIAMDLNNNIWVGTNSGACKYDGSNWTTYTSTDGLIMDAINDIKCDANGNIWFATYAGLSKYDGTTFTNYTVADGLSVDLITCLTTDGSNNLWLGTLGGGISVFDGTSFTNFGASSNIVDTNITSIAVDHLGNKWVGTFFGASVFNNSNIWVNDYTQLDGLYGDYVRDIKEDQNGNMWFGIFVDYLFDGAITKFDGTNWTSYGVPQGLVDVQVKKLAIDQQNKIWIATGSGVSKFEDITSIAKNETQISVNIFPNPASDFINVQILNNISDNKIEIINSIGQSIKEIKISSNQNYLISLEEFSEGIYFIKSGSEVSKFTVKR